VKRATPFERHPNSPNLRRRAEEGRFSLWTVALADGGPVYGERILERSDAALRRFDPSRSKLSAALLKADDLPPPAPEQTWLYLGAATGTTASHLADLVGRSGRVYAVEKSVRSFVRLVALAERYPNLFPVLADARRPEEYLGLVPPVDGLYADIAQPDQVAIVRANAREFLRAGGRLYLALKTASMGRERTAEEHARDATDALRADFTVRAPVSLEPFHRRHFMVVGRAGPAPIPSPKGAHRERTSFRRASRAGS
jgi:fibrillarin-like pre-rRNA processing protein